jgi:peptide chain release factor 2
VPRSPCCGGIFDWDTAQKRVAELNQRAEDPALWNDPAAAQKIMRERTHLQHAIDEYGRLERSVDDALTLAELGEAEGDEASLTEAEDQLRQLKAEASKRELESLLSGEADVNDCYLEVHAGAGGTEAQDWALMLLRMYVRWAEKHDYKVEWLEESPGEEAGLKSATLKIAGANAFGWLKTESGVHRLVRISPFDSQSRRHTSFGSVWVYPVVDDSIEVEIKDVDLAIDTMRSGGAGGQHVNKTESAIRITHIPTGIVVKCQADRSQHRNRATAMAMLKARLFELELQKREAQSAEIEAAKSDIGWGHQIRSYVLQPYQMVKDLRTGVETSATQAVLDGDIDEFLSAALAQRIQSAA